MVVPHELDETSDFELALSLAPKVGSELFRKIVSKQTQHGLDSRACLEMDASALTSELGMPAATAEAFADRTSSMYADLDRFKRQVGAKPVRLVTTASAIYPQRLVDFCKSPPAFLFLYGNVRLLKSKTFSVLCSRNPSADDLAAVERVAEEGVLAPMTLVGGTNTDAYQRASIVPLRWGAPRILVLDRGLFSALGDDLEDEPFRAARLWRYRFDPETDLVVSRNRPFDAFAAGNAALRDELVVALSDELRVIRMRQGGNIEKLASRAVELGRVVHSQAPG